MMTFSASAQLQDGSFAPDFTLQDINGNTWHLYELLEQGKNVIIDFSATWCPACWSYHEDGTLNEFYSTYGPEGTDEYMVFFIEGDPETNLDCLYDHPDCAGSSLGDWTGGTIYPIINDDLIAWEYDIAYWPTFYHICPNKLVSEIPSSNPKIDEMYALKDQCAVAVGENNGAVVAYEGFSGLFCALKEFSPVVRIQNLGHSPITSLKAVCSIDGVPKDTVAWTGNVVSYATFVVGFDIVTVDDDATISVQITEVNGSTDEDPANNEISVFVNSLEPREQNMLQLELRTDYYPMDTYWEITDGNGAVIYSGGNPKVVGLPDDGGAYTIYDTTYFYQVPVPGDGCYQFSIYDADGYFDGYYKLSEPNGFVLLEGGELFVIEMHHLFGIANAINPISVNGAITRVDGFPEEFCTNHGYASSIELTNIGIEPITSVEIELLQQNVILSTTSWFGFIPTGDYAIISIPLTAFTSGEEIVFRIKSINSQPDTFNFENEIRINAGWNFSQDHEIDLEMLLDHFAYEVYWQLTNSAGEVVTSGGNVKVGPDGGGARIATPSDPGCYSPDELVKVQIDLPDSVKDCYDFLVVDDYGDGLFYAGYVVFKERNSGSEIANVNYQFKTFVTDEILLDVNPLVSAVQPIPSTDHVRIFPNPAQEELNLTINIDQNLPLVISVYNMMGEVVMKRPETQYTVDTNDISLDVSSLPNGVYAISLESGGKIISRKFSIVR